MVGEYSLLEGNNPELLDMISNRIAILYDLLYEDEGNNIVNTELFEIEDEEEYEDINDLDEDILE
ncbi:unnamed protein product [marine sediment metagenome]|uniref:Uncharacterized protein n=1 Tax=marine sediment metagenome TaxID=412755 RepID=X1A0P7_9ZZZZ